MFFATYFFFLNASHSERQIPEILCRVQMIFSGLSTDRDVIYDNIERVPEHS